MNPPDRIIHAPEPSHKTDCPFTYLKPEVLIHEDDMDSVLVAGKSGDEELTANGVRGFAVHAGSGLGTGSV